MKQLCDRCQAIAVWAYMPGIENYCDLCVPRGCSCNFYPGSDNLKYLEHKDEQGRSYPCCEYHYDSNGFECEEMLEKPSY